MTSMAARLALLLAIPACSPPKSDDDTGGGSDTGTVATRDCSAPDTAGDCISSWSSGAAECVFSPILSSLSSSNKEIFS